MTKSVGAIKESGNPEFCKAQCINVMPASAEGPPHGHGGWLARGLAGCAHPGDALVTLDVNVNQAPPRMAEPSRNTYTITELAREFGLTPRAIRFYEEAGLLHPQRQGRQRVYAQRDRTRLKLTQRGKRLGMSLAEIKELVTMYESPRDTAPQLRRYLEVLALHRRDIEERMADLRTTLDEIGAYEAETRNLLRDLGEEDTPS